MAIVESPQAHCDFAIQHADITPPVGTYHRMWGAATHDRSEGIHRPLRATVIIAGPVGSDADNRQIVVALDHCLLGTEELRRFRAAVAEHAAVPEQQIVVIFSHTHAAGLMGLDRVDLPGGGGFGDANQRDPSQLARDLSNGLVANDPGPSHTNRPLQTTP